MRIALIFIFFSITAQPVTSQSYYFPVQKGAQLAYKHYDSRGREARDDDKKPMWTTYTVEDVWHRDDGNITINVLIENQQTFGLDRTIYEGVYIDNMIYGDVKIMGDSVILDNMHGLLLRGLGNVPQKDPTYERMKIKMDAVMSFPRELYVGLTLPDRTVMYAEITKYNTLKEAQRIYNEWNSALISMGINDLSPLSDFMTSFGRRRAEIKNWRVDKQENITTPAGSFNCYKITYDLEEYELRGYMHVSSLLITSRIEWVSPEIGLVKREEYLRKNKVNQTMLLESYIE